MFDVGGTLINALNQSGGGLQGAASATSRSQTPFGPQRTDAVMATAAQQAIFQEALLSSVHARLAEIKRVAHG